MFILSIHKTGQEEEVSDLVSGIKRGYELVGADFEPHAWKFADIDDSRVKGHVNNELGFSVYREPPALIAVGAFVNSYEYGD